MRQIKIVENITQRNEDSVESYLAALSHEKRITPEE